MDPSNDQFERQKSQNLEVKFRNFETFETKNFGGEKIDSKCELKIQKISQKSEILGLDSEGSENSEDQVDLNKCQFISPEEYIDHFCSMKLDGSLSQPGMFTIVDGGLQNEEPGMVTPRELGSLRNWDKHSYSGQTSFIGHSNLLENRSPINESSTTTHRLCARQLTSPFPQKTTPETPNPKPAPRRQESLSYSPNFTNYTPTNLIQALHEEDTDLKSVTTWAGLESNFTPDPDLDQAPPTSRLNALPRDGQELENESKLRHIKTLGVFVGSLFGSMLFGPVGCLGGAGCGFFGGREAIKQVKQKQLRVKLDRLRRAGDADGCGVGVNAGHGLVVRKGGRRRGGDGGGSPINLDILKKRETSDWE